MRQPRASPFVCFAYFVALSLGLFHPLSQLVAAEPAPTNAAPREILLNGALGQPVKVPTNALPAKLLPPPSVGLDHQIPQPARGISLPDAVLQRLHETQARQTNFEFFPATQPQLMPYLGAQDELGNTAIRPDPVFAVTPWDALAQRGKYWVSQYGLRYALKQSATFVSMTDVMQGDNTLGFYTLDFPAKWAVFSTANGSAAGWISSQIEAKTGLGNAGSSQSAQANLGTLTDPTSIWSRINGFRVPELAWQQSLFDGKVVALAGMIDQGNYLDGNTYANSGRGQYLNSALINSMVLPLPSGNFGIDLQWQPLPEWYAIFGGSAGNAPGGQAPWTDFSWRSWSLVWEIGYAPKDVLGLGPGVYRIQPFVAQASGVMQTSYTLTIPGTTNSTTVTVNSTTNTSPQAGLCFNLQQQLGEDAPFGWFGRFGFGSSLVSAGASAQVATGLGIRGPLAYAGLFPSRQNDAAGFGFVWSQPSWSPTPPAYQNEYVLEAGYVLQLTPFARLQPDLQLIWNPANNPNANHALVFQFQFDVAW